ncbi:KdsC family phosphatase [Chromobacterium piscinae]|uniref:KdsC family phosphatase n=1 Tax=Chromobacterium piscinae TaxID=686831 RepID=UPI001C8BB783|nr:HAD-IIIA family hydrolase [Chromobacterium piscinae]MBX9299391.1 HAD-IIIA family hydrolase [Chromobacterium vaccinii]MBX9356209.1 HAD-IIIA family hydrolase [Chromobacterium vaccinii]MCD4506861.1 HAD-IIIA family hydrolase [Chromobacterium piscinae]
MRMISEQARKVKLLIMDVDGVMTDGRIYYDARGEESKSFYVQDGLGLRLLQGTGVQLAIISGRADRCVEHRAQALKIDHYYGGVHDKKVALTELLDKTGLSAEQCAFIGDDLIDLPILTRVGLAVAVPEAPPQVRQHCHYVTGNSGGHGAVRELAELIMQAQGTFEGVLARYLA